MTDEEFKTKLIFALNTLRESLEELNETLVTTQENRELQMS